MIIDLYSQAIFDNPYPYLEQIRAQGPVVRHDELGAWMVTSDKLIRQIMMKPDVFSMEGSPIQMLFGREAFISIDDRAVHNAMRGAWAEAFRRESLDRLIPMINDTIDMLWTPVLERLRRGETVDVAADFCRDLPAYVIASMLGVDKSDRPNIVRWSDEMGAAVISKPMADGSRSPEWVRGEEAKAELARFLRNKIEAVRKKPDNGLISQLVNAEVGATMSENSLIENCRQLLFGGNETTAKWLSHIFVVLAKHPQVRHEVARNPELIPAAAEEVMRWEPVVHRSHRVVATDDAMIGDQKVSKGDLVILFLGAANRDPERHPDPQRFDIHREQKSHLGFGVGLHSCLGVNLARQEVRLAFERILADLPDYELVDQPRYGGLGLRGPSDVMVAA